MYLHEYVLLRVRVLRAFYHHDILLTRVKRDYTAARTGEVYTMIYDLQKADLWKRISAGLFDFIMLGILIIGLAWGISEIIDYDNYVDGLNGCYERYENEYGIDLDLIGTEDYDKLSDEEKAKYAAADEKFKVDEEAIYYHNMIINLMFVILVLSVLIGYLLLEFVVPLLFGNGQTLGKKIFSIGVMRYDGVKITPLLMFVRTVLGKCTIETLVPALVAFMVLAGTGGIFGIIFLVAMVIAQIVFVLITRERTLIHDIMAQTVVIDISSQMIFDTPEALLEYKQKVQAEKASRAEY